MGLTNKVFKTRVGPECGIRQTTHYCSSLDLYRALTEESTNNIKRPLSAISLRAPKSLPPQIDRRRNNSDAMDEWPDDQSFKLNKYFVFALIKFLPSIYILFKFYSNSIVLGGFDVIS